MADRAFRTLTGTGPLNRITYGMAMLRQLLRMALFHWDSTPKPRGGTSWSSRLRFERRAERYKS